MCSLLQPFRVRVFNVESTLELWLSITSISQRRPNPARGNRNSWNKIYAVYGPPHMKTLRVLHPFNFHLFNTPWQYLQCHRSFSMKWYEWMKASVLRYELSICQMCSGRQVLVPIKLTIYTASFTKMPQSHGKGMSPFFMDSFYVGFSGYKNIGKCSSSLNTSRFQLWLADESNLCPFSWGESSSVQQRDFFLLIKLLWSGFEMMTLQNVKNISHSLMFSQLGVNIIYKISP